MTATKKASALLTFLAAVSLAAAGCGDAGNKTTQHRYADDGYMGNSTANPGILTSPGSRTYGRDTDTVAEALRHVPHIRRSWVHYRGGTAIVHIKVDRGLSRKEAEAVRQDAERRLQFNLPRYIVKVRMSR